MKKILKNLVRINVLGIFAASLIFTAQSAEARLVNDVDVQVLPDGYEVTIEFDFTMRYHTHTPEEIGDYLRVELRPVNFQTLDEEQVDELRERVTLGWEKELEIPLQDITYEGGDPERPEISFTFTKEVEFEVRSGVDLRSLIVTIKTEVPLPVIREEVRGEPEVNELLDEAKVAMTEQDYGRAIQLYTKILNITKEEAVQKEALEYLGLAREKNGQFAHAKAQYTKYLKQYPDGSDAQRVQQRLAGLVTAAKMPKEKIEEVRRTRKTIEKKKWRSRYYGNISQFFFRDQTFQEGGNSQVNRNDLTTDVDLNARWISDVYDIRTKYTGSYQNNFISGEDDQDRLSALSAEVRQKNLGLFGKIGRQSRTSGGVLGRFDGVHVAYDIFPDIVVNGVFGFPVESTKVVKVETAREFYGVSADFGTYADHWDFTTFYIQQDNDGVKDREAVGGEVRYFDLKKSFFSLVDYDVFYDVLNILRFNGNYKTKTKTAFNIVYDYRRSPLLTTNNAIQGQGVTELDDLFDIYTEDELNQLAKDRSAVSKSLTLGVTQDIFENTQVSGEVTVSELEGTKASGGVEAVPGTGKDYSYSLQLINSNVLLENDSFISSVRYSDTSSNDTYTFTINSRFPLTRDFRVNPKFRVSYRDDKDSDDNRVTVRPTLRLDYRLKKWLRFEVDGGFEWQSAKASGIKTNSTEMFITAGYRVIF